MQTVKTHKNHNIEQTPLQTEKTPFA